MIIHPHPGEPMKKLAFLLLAAASICNAQNYTRGIGVYPGDPNQYTGPTLAADQTTYRNLALHRPAYQSSAYDYNLTAQLVTDGIRSHDLPRWISTATSDGLPRKNEREFFLDGNVTSFALVHGEKAWVEFGIEGGGSLPQLDRIDLYLRTFIGKKPAGGWTYIVLGSDDHSSWSELGRSIGSVWPDMSDSNAAFEQTIPFTAPARCRYYRVQLYSPGVESWRVAELSLFNKGNEVRVSGPGDFTSAQFSSAWMSAGSAEEWVYVDLGAICSFDGVKLSWIRPAIEGSIQISNDASQWQTIQPLSPAAGLTDDIRLAQPASARYVRVLMTKPAQPGSYILSELEVFGRGGPVAIPKPALPPEADGALNLVGGAWRVQRASLVPAPGQVISAAGFADQDWIVATVPGTVLTSYLNVGAIANPDFGDNQYAISDSFFCADFWYRDEFIAPAAAKPQQHLWLNFDGINWKADVYLNGQNIGRIEGAFTRGRFDVTSLIHPGARNALAVLIHKPDNPGSTKDKVGRTMNGGALGLDNPTFHASAGWDWISTIRGRDTGIWNNVTLTSSGPVTIESPLVTTTLTLPDTTRADVSIEATLHNQESTPVSGTLRARFGSITVQVPVALDPSASKTIHFDPSKYPALHLAHPKLWWPVGYGDPNLYPVQITFTANAAVSDSASFQAGIRQFKYSEDGGVLKMWINGRRFIARGGNWGFSESMLRYRSREYDVAMRYHRDLHFNMIRNWVGQTGDEALYDAADRYGVVIWQDFWLANPVDGPNPNDNDLFLRNANDYILRIRNHPSVGLYCGRNEGFPPQPIDQGLRNMVANLTPGLHYISSSADGPVSGHGPYRVMSLKDYFAHPPVKFHSEMGAPNIPEMASLRRIIPQADLWPQDKVWPVHDFFLRSMFPDFHFPPDAIQTQYGGANNIEDWDGLEQFIDYDAYRGMFEGQSKSRFGLFIWMSHPAWPSLLWQTYDYFFETDAGYFGAKKGAEPLHIQWNASTDGVEVVNDSAGRQPGLTAHAELLNIDGSVQWQKSAPLDSREDSTLTPIQIVYPANLSPTHFIRLTLTRGKTVLSSNFYLRGLKEGDYRAIRGLSPANVEAQTHVEQQGAEWLLTTELHNASASPALMVRVKAVRETTGDRILPALYDDNYIALMPNERATIQTRLEDADTRGEHPKIVVEGFNIQTEK
jgi:hypothetical protein